MNNLQLNTNIILTIAKAINKKGATLHTVQQFAWNSGINVGGWTKTAERTKQLLRVMLDRGMITAQACTDRGKRSAFLRLTESGCEIIRTLRAPKVDAPVQSTGVTEDSTLAEILDEEVALTCTHCASPLHDSLVLQGKSVCDTCAWDMKDYHDSVRTEVNCHCTHDEVCVVCDPMF